MNTNQKNLKPGDICLDYIPIDWPLTPLGIKKDPYTFGWQNKPFTAKEIKNEIEKGSCKAVGLLGGPVFNKPFGLVWIDVDGESVIDLVIELSGVDPAEALPCTLTIKSGKPGRERRLYKLSKDYWKHFTRNKYVWHTDVNHEQLEILWSKHQGALMGFHPETDGYFTPENGGFEWADNLPELPYWILDEIIKKNMRQGKPATETSRFVGPGFAINTQISIDRDMKVAVECLKLLPPEAADDYDVWIGVGQSLHSLDETLLEAWDDWSKQSEKYKEGECHRRWRSFSRDGGRGIGSLIHIAQQYGWKPSQEHRYTGPDDQMLEEFATLLNDINTQAPEAIVNTSVPIQKNLSTSERRQRNPSSNIIVDLLIKDFYKDNLLFNQTTGQFYQYSRIHPGLWSPLTRLEMLGDIRLKLQTAALKEIMPNGYSSNLMNDLFAQLQAILAFDKWYQGNNYLLFSNGVLDIDQKELIDFDKKLFLTQRMPYAYDPGATCDDIIRWLKYTQRGDWDRVQVLRAWLRAVLLSAYDMQKFVEIIGPGKSGKSTYANLCVALVGKSNSYSTDFSNLETNRFETIAFMNKKLLLFQDMDRWGGSVSKLKAITGGDWIRVERKFQAENPEPFQFHGLVMITANEAIQSTDYTSGLARRRLTIPFDRPFQGNHEEQRELIKFDNEGNPRGEFAALLPGLVNWLLDMTNEDMRGYLMETSNKVIFFKEYEKIQSLRSSPLLDWMEHKIVFAPGEKCSIGFAKIAPPGSSGSYVNWDKWLYASYCEFCKLSNVNIMSRNRFEPLFFDICKHQLKLNIFHVRNSRGLLVFNVAIRDNGPGTAKYPSIVEVSTDKEKFKEFYGDTLENSLDEKTKTDEWEKDNEVF